MTKSNTFKQVNCVSMKRKLKKQYTTTIRYLICIIYLRNIYFLIGCIIGLLESIKVFLLSQTIKHLKKCKNYFKHENAVIYVAIFV